MRKTAALISLITLLGLTGCTAQTDASSADVPSVEEDTEAGKEEGNTVTFGNYQNEDIEWYVLSKEDDKALLLSVHALDARPFNDTASTWDDSALRNWLNGAFYDTAFDADEKQEILLSHLDNGDDLHYGTSTGADTDDRVFLLSASEAEKYLTKEETVTAPTAYALSQGAYVNEQGNCAWWLRSPGMNDDGPAYYSSQGEIGTRAHKGSENIIGVRPAIWVNAEAVK